MASTRKLAAIGNWSFWLFRMMRNAGIDEAALTENFDERKELKEFLQAERAPNPPNAYKYGTRLGKHIPFTAGIAGLYAAGHLAETIRLLSAATTKIGPESALTILATLPLIVDTLLAPDAMCEKDVVIARDVFVNAIAKYGAEIDAAWEQREDMRTQDKFHKGSDTVDEAFHRFFAVAKTLEDSGNHEASDVRDACFPGILSSARDGNSEPTAPEDMYYAFLATATERDWPALNREHFDSYLEYGAHVRIGARGETRSVELVDANPRRRCKTAKQASE
ncbi:MAG: hypothetical protein ACYDGM_10555 [Vulcanimicrobiaceae bacterium]